MLPCCSLISVPPFAKPIASHAVVIGRQHPSVARNVHGKRNHEDSSSNSPPNLAIPMDEMMSSMGKVIRDSPSTAGESWYVALRDPAFRDSMPEADWYRLGECLRGALDERNAKAQRGVAGGVRVSLTAVDLEGCRGLGDAGLVAFLSGLLCRDVGPTLCLRAWYLASTNVTGVGLEALCAGMSLHPEALAALHTLGLTNNPISANAEPHGLEEEAVLVRMIKVCAKTIRRLHLNHTGLTPSLWERLGVTLGEDCDSLEKVWLKQNPLVTLEDRGAGALDPRFVW